MSRIWTILFGIVLLIIWIIAGVYVTRANILLTSFKDNDEHLHRAYWTTFWAAFVTWFLVALFILLIILAIAGVVALFSTGVGEAGAAAEAAEGMELSRLQQLQSFAQSDTGQQHIQTGLSWFSIIFVIVALALVITTDVLSAIGAASLRESPSYSETNNNLHTAYIDCIIAASVSLGTIALLIIGIIIYFIIIYRNRPQPQTLPQLQQPQIVPQFQQFQTVPQFQQFQTVPQFQQFQTVPQLQQFQTVPQLQEFQTVPQLQQPIRRQLTRPGISRTISTIRRLA